MPDGSGPRSAARSDRLKELGLLLGPLIHVEDWGLVASVRVVLVSGAAEPSEEFDATVSKPFTRQTLTDVVMPLLSRDPGSLD